MRQVMAALRGRKSSAQHTAMEPGEQWGVLDGCTLQKNKWECSDPYLTW